MDGYSYNTAFMLINKIWTIRRSKRERLYSTGDNRDIRDNEKVWKKQMVDDLIQNDALKLRHGNGINSRCAECTLKILRYSHRKIFKVCLAILQRHAWQG